MRLGVLDVALHAHVDAAEAVDDAREPAEADLDVAVDRQAGGLLEGLGQQLRAADREGGVDLVAAVPGDRQVAVAGDGDEHRLPRPAGGVHEDDRVGAPAARVAADPEGLALGGAQAGAAVGPDEQVGVPVGVRGAGAGGGGVLAGDLRPGVQRRDDDEGRPRQQGHHDDGDDPLGPPRPRRSRLAGPRGCLGSAGRGGGRCRWRRHAAGRTRRRRPGRRPGVPTTGARTRGAGRALPAAVAAVTATARVRAGCRRRRRRRPRAARAGSPGGSAGRGRRSSGSSALCGSVRGPPQCANESLGPHATPISRPTARLSHDSPTGPDTHRPWDLRAAPRCSSAGRPRRRSASTPAHRVTPAARGAAR